MLLLADHPVGVRAFHPEPCSSGFEFRAPGTPPATAEHPRNATNTPQKQRHWQYKLNTSCLVQRTGGAAGKSARSNSRHTSPSTSAGKRPPDQSVAPGPFSGPGSPLPQNARNACCRGLVPNVRRSTETTVKLDCCAAKKGRIWCHTPPRNRAGKFRPKMKLPAGDRTVPQIPTAVQYTLPPSMPKSETPCRPCKACCRLTEQVEEGVVDRRDRLVVALF